jgi:hypothetical protein
MSLQGMDGNRKKKVKMEYYNLEGGIIDFYIITNYTNTNKKISLTFWNTWDNFDKFIEWMEMVLKGQNNCIYEHIPEDVPFYFEYKNGKFYVYTWQNPISEYLMEVEIDNVDLIDELYFSFRNFIESEKYNYKLWEGILFKDFLEIKYGEIDHALNILLKMDYYQIIDLLNEGSREYGNCEYYNYDDFEKLKNTIGKSEKIDYIKNNIFEEGLNYQNGIILRNLKSKYIEKYFNK